MDFINLFKQSALFLRRLVPAIFLTKKNDFTMVGDYPETGYIVDLSHPNRHRGSICVSQAEPH